MEPLTLFFYLVDYGAVLACIFFTLVVAAEIIGFFSPESETDDK